MADRPTNDAARFAELDAIEWAMVLAKALWPQWQGLSAWARGAEALGGSAAAAWPLEAFERAAETLVGAEHVTWRPWTQGRQYAMPLARIFDVLTVAQHRGRLPADVAGAWGRAGSRSTGWNVWGHGITRARVLLLTGQVELAWQAISTTRPAPADWLVESVGAPELRLLGWDPEPQWIAAAPNDAFERYARALGDALADDLHPLEPATLHLRLEECRARGQARPPVELVRGAMLTMPASVVAPWIDPLGSTARRKLEVLGAWLRGDFSEAYERGRALATKPNTRPGLGGREGFALLLSCIDAARRGDPEAWPTLARCLDGELRRGWSGHDDALILLQALYDREVAGRRDEPDPLPRVLGKTQGWPTLLVAGLMARWLELGRSTDLEDRLAAMARHAAPLGTTAPLHRLMSTLAGDRPIPEDGLPALVGAYAARPAWEHLVDQLERMAPALAPDADGSEVAFAPRLVWQLEAEPDLELEVIPRLVTSPRSPLGRVVPVSKLRAEPPPYLDLHDDRALAAIARVHATMERDLGFVPLAGGPARIILATTLHGLIGHPRVRGPEGQRVQVRRGTPRLVGEGDAEGLQITIEPADLCRQPIAFEWTSRETLAVYETDEDLERLITAIAAVPDGRVPHQALPRLRPALGRLGRRLRIESRGAVDLSGQTVAPRAGIDVDLAWRDPTLDIIVGVRPLGPTGPRCTPGAGRPDLTAEVDGVTLATTRDLEAERAALDAVFAACPFLAQLELEADGHRFVVGHVDAYRLIDELSTAATAELVSLGWPRGRSLSLPTEYTEADMQIRIRPDRPNWLAIEGMLQVDETEVMAWRELAERRLGAGRFVRLDERRVIALSEGLRRRLEALESLDRGPLRGKPRHEALVPDLALAVFGDLLALGEDELQMHPQVGARHAQIQTALASDPRPPRGLRATLRRYQKEGFRWLARLADAGLGGVLADDMGLGKTVMALALLHRRRRDGPALVVCPTSVASNWASEAARFAPSLEIVPLADVPPDDREGVLAGLRPGQVGLLSYGLLGRLAPELDGLSMATVVFDEAHALKNPRSQRARVAASIRAAFRLGLTGTPIENHLEELRGVMEACVPGLLGDEKWFQGVIVRPIEEGDRKRADYLRRLIAPFVLRRTKAMVLDELPPRTESVVLVEPTKQQRAWYEAVRRHAQERVERLSNDRMLAKTETRIAVLAEITRLRRASVDPRLVDDGGPRGAKLDIVVTRACELVSVGHRVLVFTQFLDVIDMLDRRLAGEGIRTLILQGSTPAKERGRRIDAFQRGEADVFLMSLKAGGVGVNLTAADYVLHVDPWWNPAVEDQATARAHRLGQTRPVTVYRFCTEGSIEPRILGLHQQKRELAEDLLMGMESKRPLDLDTLRELLAGGRV